MASRLTLQEYFETLTKNVYFQPPVNTKMSYPAIRYQRTDIDNIFADDNPYHQERAYEVTVIDKNPDSTIVDEIAKMSMCRFSRHYAADGLNHDVFIIYW